MLRRCVWYVSTTQDADRLLFCWSTPLHAITAHQRKAGWGNSNTMVSASRPTKHLHTPCSWDLVCVAAEKLTPANNSCQVPTVKQPPVSTDNNAVGCPQCPQLKAHWRWVLGHEGGRSPREAASDGASRPAACAPHQPRWSDTLGGRPGDHVNS